MAVDREQPLWAILDDQGRTLRWFAEQVDYSYNHVVALRNSNRLPPPEFRRRASRALSIRESILFRDVADVSEEDEAAS